MSEHKCVDERGFSACGCHDYIETTWTTGETATVSSSPAGDGAQETRYANDPPVRHPRVRGRCPSCQIESLFLGSQGYVTCSVIGCKDPGAATDLLASLTPERAALVELEEWDLLANQLEDVSNAYDLNWDHLEVRRLLREAAAALRGETE